MKRGKRSSTVINYEDKFFRFLGTSNVAFGFTNPQNALTKSTGTKKISENQQIKFFFHRNSQFEECICSK